MSDSSDYHMLQMAFKGLWDFVTVELQWEYFRDEWLHSHREDKSGTAKNAAALREFLDDLREVPVVDQCLREVSVTEAE